MQFLTNEDDFKITRGKLLLIFTKDFPFMDLLLNKCAALNSKIIFIDVKKFPKFIKRFDLRILPTFIYFKNENEKRRVFDVIELDKQIIERFLQND